ncbi:MAG: hypothetical protein HQL40_00505 [Alphaproteobacteria bacterium]|nr:hypothetical protein [Alphaproteobacteria bacterium]
MIIVDEQQIGEVAKDAFCEHVRALLVQNFPDAKMEDDARLKKEIWEQAKLANTYGLHGKRSCATFVVTAWILGIGFDKTHSVLRRTLSDAKLAPCVRAAALEEYTLNLLVAITSRRGRE